MRSGFKFLLFTLPVAALGAGYLAYTVQTRQAPTQIETREAATPVRVAPATPAEIAPRIRGYGLVTPARTFEAIAQVSGTVTWVNPELKRGALLPAGTELLRIAQEDYALALAQAEANIRAAEAKLAELAVSETNQRDALAIEQETLALKQSDRSRTERLFDSGTTSQSARDAAQAAELAQRQKVQSIESSLALIPTQKRVQAEQVAVSEAAAETARLNLARTTFTLPFDARVSSVAVETGQFLRSGEVAAVLDGTDVAEVWAQVPVGRLRDFLQLSAPDTAAYAADPATMTNVLQQLDLGAEVRLDIGGDALTWSGRVVRVADTVDTATGTLAVIVEVSAAYRSATPGDRPPLTKGMFVEVEITGTPRSGLVIPRVALDGTGVWTADADDILRPATVAPLFLQDDLALVGDGLAPGARVVLSDLIAPRDGQPLAPVLDTDWSDRLEAAE